MNRGEYLRRQQWNAAEQLENHALLAECYWDDGRGARWVVGRSGTFVSRCEIIAGIGGSLVVHGDYDLCRFANYGDHADAWSRLRWMADCTDVDYYVEQKAAIGLCRQDIESYDADVARHYLIELAAQAVAEADDDECDEKARVLRCAIEHSESAEELGEFLSREGHRWDLWECRPGRVTSYRVVVSHVALNRCAWLLRERHGPSGPPACRVRSKTGADVDIHPSA